MLGWAHWSAVIWTLVGSALWICARTLFVLIVRDFARRFTLTIFGVRLFDRTIGRLFPDSVWSGRWRITWRVNSSDFDEANGWEGRIYRCFDTVAAEGAGHVAGGGTIPYGFVGKLSRGDSILTGTWFDRRGTQTGYHGAYQIRMPAAGNVATGKWLGFSDKRPLIKADRLVWERLGD